MAINRETTVSGSEMGLLIGVTRRRVEQLAAAGVLIRAGKGRYLVVASLEGFRKDTGDRQATRSDAEKRFRDLKADELELRIIEKERRLVAEAQEEALKVVDESCGPLKSDLLALPARLTNDLVLRRRMEDAITDAFNVAADRAEHLADMVPRDA